MRIWFVLLACLLLGDTVSAQMVNKEPLVIPTTRYTFEWDYEDLAKVDHFEVRFTSSGTWVNVGKSLSRQTPALGVGSYTAEVRACSGRVATATTCTVKTLAYTVQAAPPVDKVAPGATGLRMVLPPTLPPPPSGSVTYYETNFSSGTPAPLQTYTYGAGSCAGSTDYVDAGSAQSLRCAINRDGAAAVIARFGQLAGTPADPTANKDLYVQYRFVVGTGSHAGVGQQFKLHKATWGLQGSNRNGWSMITNNGGGLMTEPELWTNNLKPNQPNPPLTADAFVEGKPYEIVRYYRWNTAQNCGYYGLWVNGQQRVKTGCLSFMGTKNGTNEGLVLQDGAVYQQVGTGPYVVYNLYMRATDFPIGGVTF